VRVLPPLALALVAALIVTNKVGSPQFQSWLVVPILLWIVWDRRRAIAPAVLVLVIAALTHIVYPIVYQRILETQTPALVVLAARNVVLVVLLVWAVAAVWSARVQRTSSTLVV
jgi:RsiW-degrading membrane proteinase PrsW (M82 family)